MAGLLPILVDLENRERERKSESVTAKATTQVWLRFRPGSVDANQTTHMTHPILTTLSHNSLSHTLHTNTHMPSIMQ